jgi:dTDP-4-dehydrorhamnose 3,5-epimerase-like enzyme
MAYLLNGDLETDDRGTIRFVNDFDFKNVKRFYQINNHNKGFIRAWHGHKKEDKYIYVASGSALVGVVNLKTEEMEKYVLTAKKPRVLWVPAGNANGIMNLEDDTTVIVFSSKTLEESKDDDLRFPYDKWNIWDIEYR